MTISRRHFLKWTAGAAGVMAAPGCGASRQGADSAASAAPPPAADTESAPPAAASTTKTLLILGGTGFLGPHIVDRARERGMTVTLFNRGKTNAHLFPDLEKLRGDRDGNLDALKGRTWDAVVDTSGFVPRIVRDSATLLAAAVEHYVFISSISVYADFAQPGITEDYRVATVEDETTEAVRQHYGALKALCERAAETAMPARVANIRPGLIVGPRDPTDRFTYWPVRIARGGEVLAPGTGQDLTQFIDARDLAAWIVRVAEQRHAGVFNATGPAEPQTMGAMLASCRDALGSQATFTWTDASFLDEHKVAPWQHMPAWMPMQDEYLGFGSIDCRKAIDRGLAFRPLGETATATLAWFQTLPQERQTSLRAGLTPEREAELLAAWHSRNSARKVPS